MNAENNHGKEQESQLYPWSRTESAEINPVHIIARINADRPKYKRKIDIRDALVPGYQTIFADDDGQDVLWKIADMPELKALADACTEQLGVDFERSQSELWTRKEDEKIRNGIKVFYLKNRAENTAAFYSRRKVLQWTGFIRGWIDNDKEEAQKLLHQGALDISTIDVMKSLVAQVVAREMGEQANP